MEFNHLHFYAQNVTAWRRWFVQTWGGTAIDDEGSGSEGRALIYLGQVPLLISAPQSSEDEVATYLRQHPAGIGDVAFRVRDLDQTLDQVLRAGGRLLGAIQVDAQGRGRWGQIQGWGPLRHTLVETPCPGAWVPGQGSQGHPETFSACATRCINRIDHAVINVPLGQLAAAQDWYSCQLGFQPQQQFDIDTTWSGLRSQVLAHPGGGAQLPINEPTTANSQVQEFLDWNGGVGVQHVALHTADILHTVGCLKQAGVNFLEVPDRYYALLPDRQGYQADVGLERAIAQLKILVDWEATLPQARLLQTFTQPCLDIPTFFFELIQRQTVCLNGIEHCAQGFGQRNFQALFEAIEQEQRKRGSLV